MTRRAATTPPTPPTIASVISAAAEAARSDRTYRRRIKQLRDTAVRSAITTRLQITNNQAHAELLEMPDGSVAAVNHIRRPGRPNRPTPLSGDDLTMAKAILNRLDPTSSQADTEEQCCDQPHPPGHCHRFLPQGTQCWRCVRAA